MLFNAELVCRVSARDAVCAQAQELGFALVRVVTGENAGAMRPRIPGHPIDTELA